MEDKNFYVSVTYPQYYWKVSITLRGCLEKIFHFSPRIIGNFHCKTSYFVKRKMPLTYIGHLKMGFTRFLIKNLAKNFFDN